MNGIPLSPTTAIPIGFQHRSPGANEVFRSKNKKRDDAIRKKVEQELGKRTTRRRQSGGAVSMTRSSRGTVSSLRPNPAITIAENSKIIQAAQLMAAKRTDAVLVLGENGSLMGILTDKDIAFRVVAEGLDLRSTSVSQVMTAKPIFVYDKGSRNEALNIMISRQFRHLPVMSDVDEYEGDSSSQSQVVGLLDITKCVFERLDDLERKVMEDQSIMTAMEVLERRGNMNPEKIDTMRTEHECPDIASVINKSGKKLGDFPSVDARSSVREAARIMKSFHSTAVLVTGTPDGQDKIGGILTTKDIVLRVIAASLDPATTSVVRVMTPHPDFVPSNASILDALKKLHVGHFIHLPVIDDTKPVGLIDVMTLTIAMLKYLVSKSGIVTDLTDEGPMWNSFWNNTFSGVIEPDRVSQASDSRAVLSASYASYKGAKSDRPQSPDHSVRESLASRQLFIPDGPFSFKLKDLAPTGTGKIYRFSSQSNSLAALYENVCEKTGYTTVYEIDQESLDINTTSGAKVRLCYVDDEDDIVVLESDKDLQEAVHMAFTLNLTRLVIYLGDPTSQVRIQAEQQSRASSASSGAYRSYEKTNPLAISHPESQDMTSNLFSTLKEAPLAVNVALSASIVVAAYWIIKKIG